MHWYQLMNRQGVKIIKAISWITGLILVIALFLIIFQLSANNLEFSRYNPGWNGTTSFFSDLDRHHTLDANDPSALAGQPRNATLLIIAPKRYPTAPELAAYRDFLRQGNRIILVDDFGTGNAILDGIGSTINILPGNLSSLDRQYPDPGSVVAYRVTGENEFSLPADIALNYAAPLEGGSPLILTSVLSWVDVNGDRRLNFGEDMGTFPVMAIETIGPGQVIVLSDPSIFINSMYHQAENENNRFLIRSLVSSDGLVLIDQMNSRTADDTAFGEILHIIKNTVIIEVIILCLIILGMAWTWKQKIM